MKYNIITDYQEFQDLRNEWNSLLSQSQANSVFLTWEWLDAWWQSYRTTERLCIILFRNNQRELVGIAPFVVNYIKGGYFFRYKAIYFFGLNMDVSESEYLDIIAEKGLEEEICSQVIEVLNEKCNDWDIFLYHEVPEDSVCFNLIKKSLVNSRWLLKDSFHACSFINFPETFDEYLKGLKPRIRTKLRSLPRRLNENHAVEFKVCTKENLSEVLASLIDLHQKRWEAMDQYGSFRDSRRRKFYEILSSYFIENNWLKLFSLKVDGIYRAHEFCFLYNNIVFLLQEGYDIEWDRQGAGNVLRTFIMKHCIEKEYNEYDFLGGTTFHKNCWGIKTKKSFSITSGRRNLKTLVFLYTPHIIEKLKIFYRTVMPKALVQWRIDFVNARKVKKVRETLTHESIMDKVVND